jgi:hypothetical protein
MVMTYTPDLTGRPAPDPAASPTVAPWSLAMIRRLGKELDGRSDRLHQFDNYYKGEQRLAFATSKFRQAFGNLFAAFSDNFCALVVDAIEERLDVEGFRIGREHGDATGNVMNTEERTAWRIWQANQLDAYSQIAHTEALVKEQSYAIVWAGDKRDTPDITIEDAFNTIVAYDPRSYRRRIAGLKRWIGDNGYLNVTLYLPDRIEKYQSASAKSTPGEWTDVSNTILVPRVLASEDWPLRNPLGVVPVVPLINRPRLRGVGRSEIDGVLPIQDAINKLVTDMIVSSEYASFRQRWATGIEIPVDESTGEPVENLKAAVDRMWASANEEAKFGEFEAADLRPFVAGVEMLIQHVASSTRTPYHYFLQHGGQPPSGESLRASETGLVAKAKRKQRHFGEAWEEVIQLAGKVIGDAVLGADESAETNWRDPESRTEAEHVDALVKLASISVPHAQLWEDAGYSPQQIERFKDMSAAQAAEAAAAFALLPPTATGAFGRPAAPSNGTGPTPGMPMMAANGSNPPS